jgi:DNA-binding transcriptional MerR regulator
VQAAALYLGGISPWTIRSFVENGLLVPVRLPSCRRPGENGRRLLFDVHDLDALIERGKTA